MVSIQPSRVGGDQLRYVSAVAGSEFQSTPPVWGATCQCWQSPRLIHVSIHASRVGGDERSTICCASCKVQSTPPVWEGAMEKIRGLPDQIVSIHASRVGGDICAPPSMIGCCPEFQSTPPVWEATIAFSASSPVNPGFNPRLPCGRRQEAS